MANNSNGETSSSLKEEELKVLDCDQSIVHDITHKEISSSFNKDLTWDEVNQLLIVSDKNNGISDKGLVSFEEAINIVGTGYFQYKVTIIGGLVILASYLTSNVIAFILPAAHCDLHMSSEDKGNLASVFFVGIIVSCHLWGFLSDTLGRRYVILKCIFVDSLLYVLTMTTNNFHTVLFLRFLNGIASCGASVSLYAYVGEFQTSKFRSLSLMISSSIASLAYCIMPSVAWLVLPGKWQVQLYPGNSFRPWKLFYVLCGVPSLISSIFLYFLPESPKFLLAIGKNEKALEVLKRMYQENHGKNYILPIKGIRPNEKEKVGKLDANMNKVLAIVKLIWNQTVPLLKKPHRLNMILLLTSFFTNVYSNNGLYVWVPTAINKLEIYKNETGKQDGTYCDVLQYKNNHFSIDNNRKNLTRELTRNFIVSNLSDQYYGTNKHHEVTETCNDEVDTSVYFIYLIMGIIMTITWITLTIVMEVLQKKYLILVMLFVCLLSLISMKISNNLIAVPFEACVAILTCGFVFPIINSITVDLFPTNLRAMALCLAMLTSRFGSICAHTMSGILMERNCDFLIWSYIVATIANFLSNTFLPSKPPVHRN